MSDGGDVLYTREHSEVSVQAKKNINMISMSKAMYQMTEELIPICECLH